MADCLSLNATSHRLGQLAREKEEKRAQERRRNLLYIVAAFLCEQGYTNTIDTLFKEAHLTRDIQVCDNIDLENIILEYSDYYYTKFNKYPRFCKKVEPSGSSNLISTTGVKNGKCNKINYKHEDSKNKDDSTIMKGKSLQKGINYVSANDVNFGMTVTSIFPAENCERNTIKSFNDEFVSDHDKIWKPINDIYPSGSELYDIANIISKEIVMKDLKVHWDDVKGLNDCKASLKEAIVYPMKYPVMFNGKFSPWRGILLYGPPGTGKTMLAKSVATECHCTFFNITASSMISKWRGESEKYIRVLIELANHYSPAIIFFDEIDWITTKDTDVSSSNPEPARRFRAELLARLDGLLSTDNVNVILLAATNLPWNIDAALLRRLEKRIFVRLPGEDSRDEIMRFYLEKNLHNTSEFQWLLKETEGYSCADLKLLCKEAWMNQVRPILRDLESNNKDVNANILKHGNVITNISYISTAMNAIKPTAKHINTKYLEWEKKLS